MNNFINDIHNELNSGAKLINLYKLLKKYSDNDWKKYIKINEKTYNREKIYDCDLFDIYIITWNIGQKSLIHNHAENGCILRVLQGELVETMYDYNLNFLETNIFDDLENNISYMDNTIGLHKIENNGVEIAVSLHIYSPPNHITKYF